MKFDDFWQSVIKKLAVPTTLATLDQSKPFRCRYYADDIIVTPESTERERPIDKTQFQKVWKRACRLVAQDQFKPGTYQDLTVNASYIVTVMNHMLKQEKIDCEETRPREKRWRVIR